MPASDPAAQALADLSAAAEGLLMPSESEAPFTPFRWESAAPLSPAGLLAQLGLPATTPVEQADALALLDRLAADQDWFGPAERALAQRFAALRAVVATTLAEPTLYRLGRIEVTLIIAGRTSNGPIVGLRTMVVET